MNMDFKNQDLELDYLTLNLPNSVQRISEFANIFYKYGFNSKVFYVATNAYESIIEDKKLSNTLTFRVEMDSWNKETLFLQFSGQNSRKIYSLIKDGSFYISQLNCRTIKIGRIDIRHIRPDEMKDGDVNEFLEKSLQVCKDGILQKNKSNKSQTLAIGKRENSYYMRIYKRYSILKFELEIKKRPAQRLGLFLLKGLYQEFENSSSSIFLKHSWKSLYLNTCFTDWLNYLLRPYSSKPKKHLVTSYLKKLSNSSSESSKFYRLLQFLSFVREYSGEKQILNGQSYIVVEFLLSDFMKSLKCQKNSHQRKQFIGFFTELQTLPPYREEFADKDFQQVLFFPVIRKSQETKRGPWIIKIAIAEPLMTDPYPFHFPPSFFTYSNKVNLQVKLSIIQAIAQDPSIQKTYNVEIFLNKFTKRRNSIQAIVKKTIIEEFHNLVKFKIIQPKFRIQGKDNQQSIEKDFIEFKDLKSAKSITFYEIILIS